MPASVAPAARRCTARAPPAAPSRRAPRSSARPAARRSARMSAGAPARTTGRSGGSSPSSSPTSPARPRSAGSSTRRRCATSRATSSSCCTRRSNGSAGRRRSSSGDAILAVFGIPQTHEDDPERAVRAALAAHDQFAAFADRVRAEYGAEVGLRIGVNTGEVVAGREAAARGELMVSGDAVNVVARLQQTARPGEVLVGERTHVATNRAITYGARREIEVKGTGTGFPAWAALVAAVEPTIRTAGSLSRAVHRQRRGAGRARRGRLAGRSRPRRAIRDALRGGGRRKVATPQRAARSSAGRARSEGAMPALRRRDHLLAARRGCEDRCGDLRHRPFRRGAGEAQARCRVGRRGRAAATSSRRSRGRSVCRCPARRSSRPTPSTFARRSRMPGSNTSEHSAANSSRSSSSRMSTGRLRRCSTCWSISRSLSPGREC